MPGWLFRSDMPRVVVGENKVEFTCSPLCFMPVYRGAFQWRLGCRLTSRFSSNLYVNTAKQYRYARLTATARAKFPAQAASPTGDNEVDEPEAKAMGHLQGEPRSPIGNSI